MDFLKDNIFIGGGTVLPNTSIQNSIIIGDGIASQTGQFVLASEGKPLTIYDTRISPHLSITSYYLPITLNNVQYYLPLYM